MKRFHHIKKRFTIVLFKRTHLLFFLLFQAAYSHAQTTNISGVVNTYHKVIEVIPAKACLRVANPAGLVVNKLIMVVQMKGATISTVNNSTFGDTISLNGAGNYEIGTICYIIGDSVFLFHNLLNSYDVSAKFNLVQFAEYVSANVTDTVKAARWDSTSGLGGVIAIFADQDITLNAPVYADTSGYSGGIFYSNSGTCGFAQPVGTGFAYDITSTNNLNGAYKGEGVSNIPVTLNSAKGAPANGGGGGNNHNNSGGGGANLTGGGNGGGNSSGVPFGCATTGNYGRAGKALKTWNETKIFLGGGAGAGHANNGSTLFNYGGNGGGIIFIWANNLNGNNQKITAGGGKGGDSQADGAGGGGAGGTIIMHVSNYTGNVNISANGGNGGDSFDDNSIIRCFGGGGGGSGGAIYFTGSTPAVTISVNGGAGGAEFNRNAGCNAAVPGVAGSNGQIFSAYNFQRSFTPAGYCLLLLPSRLLYFTGQLINKTFVLNWHVEHPELVENFIVERKTASGNWESLFVIEATGTRLKYTVTDNHPLSGNNFYRIKVTEKNGSYYYSETRRLWLPLSASSFMVYPNPAHERVIVSGKFEGNMPLQIMDVSGKLIWQKILTENIADVTLPRLLPGLYVLKYKEAVKKLVIY